MKILQQIQYYPYSWLNFEYLPESQGQKFEVDFNGDSTVAEVVSIFKNLFEGFIDGLLVGQFGVNAEWGNFCLDTWDFENDRYDYLPEGKSKSTARYLNMLSSNGVEPGYDGYCKSLNWDEFLPTILECIFDHTAPYSVMIYCPEFEFVFYFHYSRTIGVYYKELNEGILEIVQKAKSEGLVVQDASDRRLVAIMG